MDRTRSIPIIAQLAIAAALADATFAQTSSDRGVSNPPFSQPVDQGFADTNPLSASTRVLQRDLRAPSGFDRVYRLYGSGSGEMYARASGGLTAVFPRSAYRSTSRGIVAEVPAGTVYYIGKLPNTLSGYDRSRSPGASGANRADSGVSVLLAPDRPASAFPIRPGETHTPTLDTPREPPPNAIFASDETRRRRVESLMDRAIAARS